MSAFVITVAFSDDVLRAPGLVVSSVRRASSSAARTHGQVARGLKAGPTRLGPEVTRRLLKVSPDLPDASSRKKLTMFN
jgi:hypothetical protein